MYVYIYIHIMYLCLCVFASMAKKTCMLRVSVSAWGLVIREVFGALVWEAVTPAWDPKCWQSFSSSYGKHLQNSQLTNAPIKIPFQNQSCIILPAPQSECVVHSTFQRPCSATMTPEMMPSSSKLWYYTRLKHNLQVSTLQKFTIANFVQGMYLVQSFCEGTGCQRQ